MVNYIYTDNVQVTLSGISALLILGYHKKRGYGRYSTPEMLLDAFFAVYLLTVYIVVLALSTNVREHMVSVYGNLACLVSGYVKPSPSPSTYLQC